MQNPNQTRQNYPSNYGQPQPDQSLRSRLPSSFNPSSRIRSTKTPPLPTAQPEPFYYQPQKETEADSKRPVNTFTYIFLGLFILMTLFLAWELWAPYNLKLSTAIGIVTPESTLNSFEECQLAGGELTDTQPQNCKINGIIYSPEVNRNDFRRQIEAELRPEIEAELRPEITQELIKELEEEIRAKIAAEQEQNP